MFGYGAVLLQKNASDGRLHPVYYASGKTSLAEQKYSSYELEVLAIVRAPKKFRVYLLGIPFKIVTDCRAFALTMKKRDLGVRVARWVLLLEEFEYEIEHRSGTRMLHVDALSRNPVSTCLAIEECIDSLSCRFAKAQRDDVHISRIINLVGKEQITGYTLRGGVLFKEIKGELKLAVPKSMAPQILREAHERGHFSSAKTEAIVDKEY